jgi:hypothetical protein
MRDLRTYWQEVRAIERTLPESVWLISVEDWLNERTGGQVVQVSSSTGAQLIRSKSHRLATDAEISSYRALEETAGRQAVREDLRHAGIAIVPIPPPDTSD